jgi:O-antigen ligase
VVKNYLNKSWYYSIFLIAAFPLFGLKLTSLFILLFGVLSLSVIIVGKKSSFNKKHLKWLALFSSIYLIYAISVFLHPINRVGELILEKKLSLLIFPIILFLIPIRITKDHFRKLLFVFMSASVGIAAISNLYIMIRGIPLKYFMFADFSFAYRTFFEHVSGIHPTYISIFLAFSALIALRFGLENKEKRKWYIIIFITCLVCLVPLAAKLPMIAFIVALGCYFLIQPKIWKKARFIFIALIAGVLITMFTVPSLKIRVDEIIDSSFTPPQGFGYNSIEVRSGIWECCFSLIPNNWISGIGPAQLQTELNNCYERFDTNAYTSFEYNTHNEYFNILLGTGILGLVSFLLLLFSITYLAYKAKNPLFFCFMILLLLCFITENILARQTGILFFAFFTSLFTRYYILQANEDDT